MLIRRLSLYNVLLMRCNFGLLGSINVIVKFCSASDVMYERRLTLHDDYHLSSNTKNLLYINAIIHCACAYSVYAYIPQMIAYENKRYALQGSPHNKLRQNGWV